MTLSNTSKSGFALLITLLVVSVVIAVTLSIIELSLKQLDLSIDSRDSEVAFHAASAGLDCAQRTSRLSTSTIEIGGSLTFRCFNTSRTVNNGNNLSGLNNQDPANGDVFRYQTSFEWGTGVNTRCSDIDIITVVALTGNTAVSGLLAEVPSYPSNTKNCIRGERCTIASVAGYSSSCAQKGALGTLKREILLEF